MESHCCFVGLHVFSGMELTGRGRFPAAHVSAPGVWRVDCEVELSQLAAVSRQYRGTGGATAVAMTVLLAQGNTQHVMPEGPQRLNLKHKQPTHTV